MYTINLPDDVMIPHALLEYVEAGSLGEKAHQAADAWVEANKTAKDNMQVFWRKRITRNVAVCQRYDAPECADFFSYVQERIEELW